MPYKRQSRYKDASGRERTCTVFYTDIRPRKNGVPTGERVRKLIPKVKNMTEAIEAERKIAASILEGRETVEVPYLYDFLETIYLPWARLNKAKPYLDERAVRFFRASESLKGRRLDEVSVIQVEGYKRERKGAVSTRKRPFKLSSLNKELTILSRAFRLAVEGGLVRVNPVRLVKFFDEEAAPFRVLERDEESRLWEALRAGAWYLLPFARLALLTGMREGELLNLQVSDVDFGRGLVFVRNPKWKQDARKTEGLPVSSEALNVLRELCRKARGGRLFWHEGDGRALVPCTVSNLFRHHARRVGLMGLKPHSLRHTFGTRLGEAGCDAYEIRKLMGHSSITTTQVYVHPRVMRLREAVEAVSSSRGHSADTRKTGTGD
jgi:integrase/recombinase XerD